MTIVAGTALPNVSAPPTTFPAGTYQLVARAQMLSPVANLSCATSAGLSCNTAPSGGASQTTWFHTVPPAGTSDVVVPSVETFTTPGSGQGNEYSYTTCFTLIAPSSPNSVVITMNVGQFAVNSTCGWDIYIYPVLGACLAKPNQTCGTVVSAASLLQEEVREYNSSSAARDARLALIRATRIPYGVSTSAVPADAVISEDNSPDDCKEADLDKSVHISRLMAHQLSQALAGK